MDSTKCILPLPCDYKVNGEWHEGFCHKLDVMGENNMPIAIVQHQESGQIQVIPATAVRIKTE